MIKKSMIVVLSIILSATIGIAQDVNKEITKTYSSSSELELLGAKDASYYYEGKGSGFFAIWLSTIVFTPVVGAIPALIVGSVRPNERNLNYKDSDLMKNEHYRKGYEEKAFAIKKNVILTNYSLGVGTWSTIILFVALL